MIYADLPAGALVFVDAGLFIHHFEPNALYGPASTAFLERISIDPSWLDSAAAVSQQTGLLHNDALVVAAMRAHSLVNLASADSDFDRVSGLTRFGPV